MQHLKSSNHIFSDHEAVGKNLKQTLLSLCTFQCKVKYCNGTLLSLQLMCYIAS